jgi:hypothetical protein
MLYDLVSQDVSLMQKVRGTYNLCEHRQSRKFRGNVVSIDSLVQKSGGMYNLCEHRQTSAKVRGNVQPL